MRRFDPVNHGYDGPMPKKVPTIIRPEDSLSDEKD
jgi:hypothetical protein